MVELLWKERHKVILYMEDTYGLINDENFRTRYFDLIKIFKNILLYTLL